MFSEMLSMPQAGASEDWEGTETKPVYLPNVAEPEFDIFVLQAYGK